MYKELVERVDLNDVTTLVNVRSDLRSKWEWAEENLDTDEFEEVIDLYDFLSEKIADHYIQNYL